MISKTQTISKRIFVRKFHFLNLPIIFAEIFYFLFLFGKKFSSLKVILNLFHTHKRLLEQFRSGDFDTEEKDCQDQPKLINWRCYSINKDCCQTKGELTKPLETTLIEFKKRSQAVRFIQKQKNGVSHMLKPKDVKGDFARHKIKQILNRIILLAMKN